MTRMIKPIMGRKYKLYTSEDSKNQASFFGFYIGKKDLVTPDYIELLNPEGHVFVRKNTNENLEIYCARSSKNRLQLWYYSDGEDGPEWEAGFSVQRIESKLSKSENQFLQDRLSE